jgi:hypothetical protein
VCDGKDNNCDGTPDEGFDLQSDPQNCGSCGILCPSYDHAETLCSEGQCLMGPCEDGWLDQDDDPANGCEFDLSGCTSWQAEVKASIGQSDTSCMIGMSPLEDVIPAPDAPEYAIRMRIKDPASGQYYEQDIRSCVSEYEYWILRVEINSDSVEPGSYPLLSWNPEELSSEGYYSLFRVCCSDAGQHLADWPGVLGGGTCSKIISDLRSGDNFIFRGAISRLVPDRRAILSSCSFSPSIRRNRSTLFF